MVLKIDVRGEGEYRTPRDAVHVWHLTDTGATVERVPDYTPTLFVHGPDRSELQTVQGHVSRFPNVESTALESHRPGFRHDAEPMLRVDVERVAAVTDVARQIRGWGDPGTYRLYDVDLSPEFRYCLATDTAPGPDTGRELRTCRLSAEPTALVDDGLSHLTVDDTTIAGPATILEYLDERLESTDPDILIVSRAAIIPRLFDLADQLDYEGFALGRRPGYEQRAGRSTYTSYGRVGHSPARYSVPGRVIINQQNSFLWHETNLDGCLDLVRRSGKPLQELGWASIGNVLTAIQIREARERDVRVPWNSWRHEFVKSMRTLHDADRGGFIFDPEVGVHETVHEIDFSSMYPNIMVSRNISPETVCCDCHDGDDVPGLGYSICEERGYLADVLEPIITDRQAIKEELRSLQPNMATQGSESAAQHGAVGDEKRLRELRGKSAALKWILVSCFGYQGFSAAKFGRIEAHEAINAVARELLLDAKAELEAGGWHVVHGIVDSLWVVPADGREQTPLDDLCAQITDTVDIDLEHEAAYDWVAFVPQRNSDAGALTKYFGKEVDADRYKYRGIECRQRSTCAYVERVQRELIRAFDEHRAPEPVCDLLQRRLDDLTSGSVDATALRITNRVSKPADAYEHRTRAVVALERAAHHGLDIHAGESVDYVVANDDVQSLDRVRLGFEVEPGSTAYDSSFYRERLLRAAASILSPLGWRQNDIEQYLAARTDASLVAYT